MKKSQLRNIIKEEVKRLRKQPLKEQGSQTPNQLMTNFGTYLASININFKVLVACGGTDNQISNNMLAWLQGIFALSPFNSTNPNQPCQFINNKINQLTNWINNFTGNPNSIQLAQKKCKRKILTYLGQMFSC